MLCEEESRQEGGKYVRDDFRVEKGAARGTDDTDVSEQEKKRRVCGCREEEEKRRVRREVREQASQALIGNLVDCRLQTTRKSSSETRHDATQRSVWRTVRRKPKARIKRSRISKFLEQCNVSLVGSLSHPSSVTATGRFMRCDRPPTCVVDSFVAFSLYADFTRDGYFVLSYTLQATQLSNILDAPQPGRPRLAMKGCEVSGSANMKLRFARDTTQLLYHGRIERSVH